MDRGKEFLTGAGNVLRGGDNSVKGSAGLDDGFTVGAGLPTAVQADTDHAILPGRVRFHVRAGLAGVVTVEHAVQGTVIVFRLNRMIVLAEWGMMVVMQDHPRAFVNVRRTGMCPRSAGRKQCGQHKGSHHKPM